MIQFNLLPDVKLDYVRTHRTKRIVTLVAGSIAAGSLTILVLLFLAVNVVQKNRLDGLSESIAEDTKTLQETPNLNKVLTVQNQLNSLTELHSRKPQLTRLDGYLQKITPTNVSIADLNIEFEGSAMTFSGAANNLATINKFIDTLKFTTYKYDDITGSPFSNVVLASFSNGQTEATYQITLLFDPVIFDSTKTITLDVPNTVTTRSATDKPLFQSKSILPEAQ